MNKLIPRRGFLKAGVSALGLAPLFIRAAGPSSPNSQITIGIIGYGAMGKVNTTNFLNIPEVRVVAVSDVDANEAEAAKAAVDGHYQDTNCHSYAHYQDLLEHPGLDAVCICAPDHWHARLGMDAVMAGLDVYGEKPFAWGLGEGRALVNAVTEHKRVWQTGSMQRSMGEFRRFKALILNQTLGKLTRLECGTPAGMAINPHHTPEQIASSLGHPPAHLDWSTWLGPVKGLPYNASLHPWNWRWHDSFGGGQLMDWVGHHVDTALWTLGLENDGPVKVEATGKRPEEGLFNTYIEYAYSGTYPDGRVIEVRSDFMGVKFTGENGWIHVDRGALKASDREMLRNLPADFEARAPSHNQNFIDCVRSRATPICSAGSSHHSASLGQLAIVALDSGQPVRWDPVTEKVIGNPGQAAHPRLGSRLDF